MKSCAICILGMHRSGTSLISRSINILGAYIGEAVDLMAPSPDNPTAYWEHNDIVNLHDRMLDKLKQPWHTGAPLPEGWHLTDEIQPLRNELIELIKKKFSDRQLWAWKDPRTSILIPIWKDILKEMSIKLLTIFVIRNPLDVAKSLKKRDGFSFDKSFGVWNNYNISALRAVLDLQHIFIHYDLFLNNWETELRRCAAFLSIDWPGNDIQIKEKMNEFIRLDFRHSRSGVEALKEANAPDFTIELYEFLRERSEGASSSYGDLLAKISTFHTEFSSYGRLYKYDIDQLWKCKKQLLKTELQLEEKEKRVQSLTNTWSWKITAPLRRLKWPIKKRRIY